MLADVCSFTYVTERATQVQVRDAQAPGRCAELGCDAVGEVDSAPAGLSEQPPPVRLLNGVHQQRPAARVP